MKKIISFALILIMLVMSIPTVVLAEVGETVAETIEDMTEAIGEAVAASETTAVEETEPIEEELTEIPEDLKTLVKPVAEYDEELKGKFNDTPETAFALAKDSEENKEFVTTLLRRHLVSKATYELLEENIKKSSAFRDMIKWLFTDEEMLRDYVYGGEPEAKDYTTDLHTKKYTTEKTYIKSLNVLAQLYAKHKNDVQDGADNEKLYERLMAAIALTHSADIYYWDQVSAFGKTFTHKYEKSDPVERYELYHDWHKHDFLVAEFDHYDVERMRLVVATPFDNDQLEWLHYYCRTHGALANPDYATNPKKPTYSQGYGYNIRYQVFDCRPEALGGLGQRYYDEANREFYTDKYGLSVHDDYFDFDIHYGSHTEPNGRQTYAMQSWISLETGGVCQDISFAASAVENVFGKPSIPFHQPVHISYFKYGNPNSNGYGVYGDGYDAFGITATTNLITGPSHFLGGWSVRPWSSFWNAGYFMIGDEALGNRRNTDYKQAENLNMIAQIYISEAQEAENETDNANSQELYQKALDIFEQALKAQYFNLDSWEGVVEMYKKLGKGDDDYLKLEERIVEKLKWYTLPMYDLLINLVYPCVKDEYRQMDFIAGIDEALTLSATANKENSELVQPGYCQQFANYCRGQLTKLATFSYENKGITLNKNFAGIGPDDEKGRTFMYSVDGRKTWRTVTEFDPETLLIEFSEEDLVAINDVDDIYFKYEGAKKDHRIDITKRLPPAQNQQNNTVDDLQDKFYNINPKVEYTTVIQKDEEGNPITDEKGNEIPSKQFSDWKKLTTDDRFPGDVTVYLRFWANGTECPSNYTRAKFTQSTEDPENMFKDYVNGAITIVSVTDYRKNEYSGSPDMPMNRILDGDTISGVWYNDSVPSSYKKVTVETESGEKSSFIPNHEFDFIFEFAEPTYVSGIGYYPGTIKDFGNVSGAIRGCEVYVSEDNKDWEMVGKTVDWADDMNKKTLTFDKAGYAKYVKIHTTQVGTYHFSPINADIGLVAVKEFQFYHNALAPEKEIAALKLYDNTAKKEYKVGDKLDVNGLTAELIYSDGKQSVIPATALDYDVDIFDSTKIKKVNATFRGVSASYDVTVTENDRTPVKAVSATIADREYFAGDTFRNQDVQILVTDKNESERWYLLNNEFTVEGKLNQGTNTMTAKSDKYEGISIEFEVKASASVDHLEFVQPENFKTQYNIGEPLDLIDLQVKIVYSDDSSRILSPSEYAFDMYREVTNEDSEEKTKENVDFENFSKTSGTKVLRATLVNKDDIAELSFTVFGYIASGDFVFEAVEGTNDCVLKSCTPTGYIDGTMLEIPGKVIQNGIEFNVVEIDTGAFNSAPQVDVVSIPATVKLIKTGAFSSCPDLLYVFLISHTDLSDFVCESGAFQSEKTGYVYLNPSLTDPKSPIEHYSVASIKGTTKKIEITQAPDRLEHFLNEELDTTGLIVSAVFDSGARVETTDYTISGYEKLKTGKQNVTITMNDVNLTATFEVNVSFPEIHITTPPLSAAYKEGDGISEQVQRLTAEASDDYGNVIHYKWYKLDSAEADPQEISGETQNTYQPPQKKGWYKIGAYLTDQDGKNSEVTYSDTAYIAVGNFEVIAGPNGYYEKDGKTSLKEAIDNAADGTTVRLFKDVSLNETIYIEGKEIRLEGNGGKNYKIGRGKIDDKTYLTAELFNVNGNGGLIISNVTLDGGAVWKDNNYNSTLARTTNNSGITGTNAILVAKSKSNVSLLDGAILQNGRNYRYYAGLDNCPALRLEGSSCIVNGGIIRDNFSMERGIIALTEMDKTPSTITIEKGIITGNHAESWHSFYHQDAVIYSQRSNININGGFYSGNIGYYSGGLVYLEGGSLNITDGIFENNKVKNNESMSGGIAFATSGASINVSGMPKFEGNSAQNGGVFYLNSGTSLNISGGEFVSNRATQNGGVIYANSGASVTVSGGTFDHNMAQNGGVIYGVPDTESNGKAVPAPDITVSANTFKKNFAHNDGGAIWTGGAITISEANSFVKNKARQNGDAVYMDGEKKLTICGLSEETQEFYMKNFTSLIILGQVSGKLILVTPEELTEGMEIAENIIEDGSSIEGTLNGYSLYIEDGKLKAKIKNTV